MFALQYGIHTAVQSIRRKDELDFDEVRSATWHLFGIIVEYADKYDGHFKQYVLKCKEKAMRIFGAMVLMARFLDGSD